MLCSLEIRDLLLIDHLSLEFQPGLNVLTGETGAGKSILLDCLGFVLGWRGRADLVRQGADQGEVTAVFQLPDNHPANQVLEEAGIGAEDDLILRRINTREGRKTAWVNDRRVSGDVLRNLSQTLVELHGQHDDRGLLNPRGHRVLLDDFAGVDLGPMRAAWSAKRKAAQALEKAKEHAKALKEEEEFLRHAVGELDALNPEPGEDAALDAERRRMQGAERVRQDIARAHSALSHDGAEAMLGDAMRWLDGALDGADGRLDAPIEALSRALDALGEAEQGVADALDALSFDPYALEQAEERLFAIRGLARKHGVLPDDLAGLANELRQKLVALDAAEGDIVGLQNTLKAADVAYDDAASELSEARACAARKLETAMTAELAPLKMERAVFTVDMAESEPGPDGRDAVTFRVATNPGAPAGDLGKIASGGELSRFLLALKVCLTGEDSGLTLIFDEIDRGVGGATADAVGRRLGALADGGQVLVVTHSPQVAALGAHHWRVAKHQDADQTLSTVTPLDSAQRIDEIARMLSGENITDAARAAARELMG